jgi:hypothetical protein
VNKDELAMLFLAALFASNADEFWVGETRKWGALNLGLMGRTVEHAHAWAEFCIRMSAEQEPR